MIKYIEYDSFDEYGQHIIPLSSFSKGLIKTAGQFSPELMKVILNMKRLANRYYVVVNALGSHEYWGCNRNGDGFPERGLSHLSLRTDMNTPNDYGYKTFEYYARFYQHHVNKDPKKSFGEVVFAYWNPMIHRVELIIAIDVEKAKDIVDAIENGEQVAVSMGCKVKYDRCNICDHKSKAVKEYCVHLKKYMCHVIDADLARRWSIELGKTIKPGTQVCAINDYPRFFDLSRVFIGADRVSFMLGKAASVGTVIPSACIGMVTGITDDEVDKYARLFNKTGTIGKEVGSLGPGDIDGGVGKSTEQSVIDKALDEKMRRAIVAEPKLPNEIIDSASAALPLRSIISTMLGMGIHPKPAEFQRIVLIRMGCKPVADELERNNIVFDQNVASQIPFDFGPNDFSDQLANSLIPYMQARSSMPQFLSPRIVEIEKNASIPVLLALTMGPGIGATTAPKHEDILGIQSKPQDVTMSSAIPSTIISGLAGIGALYAYLKMKSMNVSPETIMVALSKPWFRNLLSGAAVHEVYRKINEIDESRLFTPASAYAGRLQDTGFTGIMVKKSSLGVAILYPMAYVKNFYDNRETVQPSMMKMSSISIIEPFIDTMKKSLQSIK